MKKIYWGCLFVFIDITVGSGNFKIDLFSDFVGLILLIYGMVELQNESSHFSNYIILPKLLIVVYACSFVIGFLNHSILIDIIISIASAVMHIILLFHIVKGIGTIQEKYSVNMEAQALYTCWRFFAVADFAGFLVYLVPHLVIPYVIVMLFMTFMFLVNLSKAKTNYEEYLLQKEVSD